METELTKIDYDVGSDGKEKDFINQREDVTVESRYYKDEALYVVFYANKTFYVTFKSQLDSLIKEEDATNENIWGKLLTGIHNWNKDNLKKSIYYTEFSSKNLPILADTKVDENSSDAFIHFDEKNINKSGLSELPCLYPCCSFSLDKENKKIKINEIYNINPNNACNFTSAAMALSYAGYDTNIPSTPTTKKNANGMDDTPTSEELLLTLGKTTSAYQFATTGIQNRLFELLLSIKNRSMTYSLDGYIKNSLNVPSGLKNTDGTVEPQTDKEAIKIVTNIWADQYCYAYSGQSFRESTFSVNGGATKESYSKTLLENCLEEDTSKSSIKVTTIPIIRVKGYFDGNGNFKLGGHYVCCSGIYYDTEGVQGIKIDDPWGFSPKETSGVLSSDSKTGGNNVLWKFDKFFDKLIDTSNTTIIFLKLHENRGLYVSNIYGDLETQQQIAELNKVETFINKWSCIEESSSYSESNSGDQSLLNIDHYYDFLSGMTPFVEVGFRYGFEEVNNDASYPWKYKPRVGYINSIEHPFIKSLSVEDNGVKTVTLELFDKSFGSFHDYFLRNGNFTTKNSSINETKFSLEQLIRLSLRDDIFEDENTKDWDENALMEEKVAAADSSNHQFKMTYKWSGVERVYTITYRSSHFKSKDEIERLKETIKSDLIQQLNTTANELKDIVNQIYNDYKTQADKYVKSLKKASADTTYSSTNISGSSESSEETEAEENYLKFSSLSKNAPYTNLFIRFGYADYNVAVNVDTEDVDESTSAKNIRTYFNGNSENKSNGRSNRWWDVTYGAGESWTVKPKYYIDSNNNIVENTSDSPKTLNNGNAVYSAVSSAANVSQTSQLNSKNPTTSMSRTIEMKIFGYKKTLTRTGLSYTINAVETKEQRILSQRFLQRYAEIVSYPEEVLYTLMHIFNENKGEAIKGSPIKLMFLQDKSDTDWAISEKTDTELASNIESASKILSQNYDLSLLKENNKTDTVSINYSDTYNSVLNGEAVLPKYLKKITLALGNESALTNYNQIRTEPPKYKSIGSLLNEFCAACPPKKLQILSQEKHYDKETGEEIKIDTSNQMSRPLKWFSIQDGKTIYIILYYRRELKPRYIRSYDWGPALPFKTCVTNVNIENTSEYALMTAVKSFSADKEEVTIRMKSSKEGKVGKMTSVKSATKSETVLEGTSIDLLSTTDISGDSYGVALSSGVYEGTIEMLGDPFYLFDGLVQPCTYPIKLNVYVPVDEWEWKQKGNLSGVVTARANNNYYGNQRLEDMSGYYVIKKINHSISNGSFKTTLEVLSYPNIEKMILKDPNNTLSELQS